MGNDSIPKGFYLIVLKMFNTVAPRLVTFAATF